MVLPHVSRKMFECESVILREISRLTIEGGPGSATERTRLQDLIDFAPRTRRVRNDIEQEARRLGILASENLKSDNGHSDDEDDDVDSDDDDNDSREGGEVE